MADSRAIQLAWDRVVEAAGSPDVLSGAEKVPSGRRDQLATALGSLRIVIRSIPGAEAELQRRVRWFAEHTGPGTEFHKQLEAVVVALAKLKSPRKHERNACWELRSAAASEDKRGRVLGYRRESCLEEGSVIQRKVAVKGRPIRSLQQLRDTEMVLGRLSHRPEVGDLIAVAMATADQLLKQATSEEVEAADALVGLDEMAAGGRFGAIGDVGIVDSVPLGAVGRLVELLDTLLSGPHDPPSGRSRSDSNSKASAEDHRRWEFAKPLRDKVPAVTWQTIADQYQKKTGEPTSESSIKQSWYRVQRARKQGATT